jgi:hypothetical protein
LHLERFGQADWERSLDWLDLSGLALLFWNQLRESGAESLLPFPVRARLARKETNNRMRTAEMRREFDSLNRLLAREGLVYAALKGFALIPEYCPAAALRVFTDYDYLLPHGSLERAGQALAAAGYVRHPHSDSYAVAYFKRDRPPRRITDLEEMYSARLSREVELHWRLWGEKDLGIRLKLPDDLLARTRLHECEGLQFRVLADADALIYQAMHALRHLLEGWCRLSALYELGYFLRQRFREVDFWMRFHQRINESRSLCLISGIMFALAARVFGAAVPAEVESWTVRALTPPMVLWVERYGWESAIGNFSGNKFGLLLHREFVEDPQAWRAVRRRRVFLLKWPSRLSEVSGSSRLRAGGQRLSYMLRLLWFHAGASLRYGCELVRWRRMLRRLEPASRF